MDFSTAAKVECATFVTAHFRVMRRARFLCLCCILCTLFSIQSFAQSDWTLLKSESGVEVYYKVSGCEADIDPTVVPAPEVTSQKLELKILNQNAGLATVEFYRDIKVTENASLQRVNAMAGETLVSSCELAPEVLLSQSEGDDRPVAIADYIKAFELTIRL